jgi:16S rRNA (cytosine1402-N4)-methyltransferase
VSEDPEEPEEPEEAEDAKDEWSHDPVMIAEVLRHLEPGKPGAVLYDLTLGLGGHSKAFLEAGGARAFGVDGDPLAIERTRARLAPFGERFQAEHANLRAIGRVAREKGWPRPTAVLLDLGLSSPQIEETSRGFSYRREGPLDMRFDPTSGLTAAQLLLALPSRELAAKIRELGDEPLAPEIVALIKRRLPVETTTQLAAIVREAYGGHYSRVHPARRTFQALRILVNDELAALVEGMTAAIELLEPGGTIVALSYHSGEDRLVKSVLRDASRRGELDLLTRRPERPKDAERWRNQRARSAKLRAARRV